MIIGCEIILRSYGFPGGGFRLDLALDVNSPLLMKKIEDQINIFKEVVKCREEKINELV